MCNGYTWCPEEVHECDTMGAVAKQPDTPETAIELDFEQTCEWFILCSNPTLTAVWHPILGYVPCCLRCGIKLGLVAQPA